MPSYGIHNYANREIGLISPQVQMATFTPLEFKPQFIDPEHFKSVIDKMDAADAEAQKEKTAIDIAYAEQRKKIHQDDKTRAEFDKIVEGYNQKVKDAVEASGGSYHRLGNLMKTLASDNAGNQAIAAMTQQQEEYDKWKEALRQRKESGKISDVRYRRLIAEQERDWNSNAEKLYHRDDNGNIVGTDTWVSSANVTDNLNAATLSAIITQLTAYQENTKGSSGRNPVMVDNNFKIKDKPYDINDKDGILATSSGGRTIKIQKLTKKQLDDTFNKYIAANPLILTQFADEMDDLIFEYNEWEEKLNNPLLSDSDRFKLNSQIAARSNQIFGKGAGGAGFKNPIDYFKKSMTDLIGQSAYDRRSEVSEGALDLHTGGSGSGNTNEEIDPSRYQEITPGAIVETGTGYLDQFRNKYTTSGDNTNVGGLHTQFNARRQQRKNNKTTVRR